VTSLEEMQRAQLIAYFAKHHDYIMNHHFKILIIATVLLLAAAFVATTDQLAKEKDNLSRISITYN